MHTAANEVPRHLAARVFHAVDIVEGGRRRTDAGTRLHTVRVNLACTRTIFPTICPPKLSTFDQRSTVPRRPRLDKDGFHYEFLFFFQEYKDGDGRARNVFSFYEIILLLCNNMSLLENVLGYYYISIRLG